MRPTVTNAFPFVGGLNSGTWTNLGGSGRLWKMTTTVGATPDDLSGNAILNRKRQPTLMIGGRYAMLDVSGPSSVITDGASDQFKYCIARVAGECAPGSAVGDIYANFPYLYYAGYTGGSANCVASATSMLDTNNYRNELCIGNSTPGANALVESRVDKTDLVGFGLRELTKGLSRWLVGDVFWNAQTLPDNSWALFHTLWAGGYRAEMMMVKIPPFPPDNSAVRTTFQPVPVHVTVPSNLSGSRVLVEYGYLEYGSDNINKFYCTSRRENCVVNSSTFNPAGGLYEITDAPLGRNCVTSCSFTIPAIPGRVVYWRPVFQGGSGPAYGKVKVSAAVP
jgi:hypothetical protein